MTTAHKNLTGTDLHEPKGIAAAAADKVYVSDGAGSGTWQKVTADQLDSTGNPFGAALLHVREEQSSGGASTVSTTSNAWVAEVLNSTKTNEISGASVASNQITLPAGTYHIKGMALGGAATGGVSTLAIKLRIYNVTDASALLVGLATASGANNMGNSHPAFIEGRFTLAGTKVIEFQHYAAGIYRPAQGIASTNEVYNDLLIWKVA